MTPARRYARASGRAARGGLRSTHCSVESRAEDRPGRPLRARGHLRAGRPPGGLADGTGLLLCRTRLGSSPAADAHRGHRASAQQPLQHHRDAVLLVGRGDLVGDRLSSAWALAMATPCAGPGEHRDVVGHVAEGDRLRGLHARAGGRPATGPSPWSAPAAAAPRCPRPPSTTPTRPPAARAAASRQLVVATARGAGCRACSAAPPTGPPRPSNGDDGQLARRAA